MEASFREASVQSKKLRFTTTVFAPRLAPRLPASFHESRRRSVTRGFFVSAGFCLKWPLSQVGLRLKWVFLYQHAFVSGRALVSSGFLSQAGVCLKWVLSPMASWYQVGFCLEWAFPKPLETKGLLRQQGPLETKAHLRQKAYWDRDQVRQNTCFKWLLSQHVFCLK